MFSTRASTTKPAGVRHDDKHGLRRRYDAAEPVHRELLHGAINRRAQCLELRLLRRLDQLLARLARLLLDLREIGQHGLFVFGAGLQPTVAHQEKPKSAGADVPTISPGRRAGMRRLRLSQQSRIHRPAGTAEIEFLRAGAIAVSRGAQRAERRTV